MQLLENYLKAVADGLPPDEREDILRELSEDIRSEMDEKAAEVQRPLSEAEQREILRRHGNPLLLAARYRHDNRTLSLGRELIGPALFPFYVRVLSFNLGLTFVIIGSIFTALIVAGQRVSVGAVAWNVLLQLVIQFSVVTLIFSLIQKHMSKNPDRWDLGAPRGVHLDLGYAKLGKNVRAGGRDSAWVSRFESISILVASAVALVWLRGVQLDPFLLFGPAASFLKLAPVWSQVIPVIAVLTFLEMARASINFVRPDWMRFRNIVQLLLGAGALVLILFVLNARSWVIPGEGAGTEILRRTVQIVNTAFLCVLVAAVAINAVQLVTRINRLRRAGRKQASASSVDAVC
jgi:hypothetical protein